jgi:RNA recognition motif-containing protein
MKCRALPFNKQYLGGESRKPQSLSIFAKGFPRHWTHSDLYKVFEKFGKITSAKVVFDAGLESRGYGFVSMDTNESVQKAIDGLNEKLLSEIGCEGEDLECRL